MNDDAKKERYFVNDGTETHEVHATGWILDADGLRFEVNGRCRAWFRHWFWWKQEDREGRG
jgi:hypothetical protein